MYTTIKVPRRVRDRLEGYARPRGLTLAGAIERLLEENAVVEELRAIRLLLEKQNSVLEEINAKLGGAPRMPDREARVEARVEAGEQVEEGGRGEEGLPSFASGNPWLEALSRSRRGGV